MTKINVIVERRSTGSLDVLRVFSQNALTRFVADKTSRRDGKPSR